MTRPTELTVVHTSERPDGIRTWTRCEYHLLAWLTSGPLLATRCQICEQGVGGPFSKTARHKALSNLQTHGWCQSFRIHTLSPRRPKQPWVVCQPDKPSPNFRELKDKLKLLGKQAPKWQTLRVYVPSRQASNLFGRPYDGIGMPAHHAYRLAITHVSVANPFSAGQAWIWDTHPGFRPYEQALGICYPTKTGQIHSVGILREQSIQSLGRLHALSTQQGWPLELW